MLTLFSFGPAANSLKPLAVLYEKYLTFEQRFVDPDKFEQHSDWFKAINPRGQVPALDHDGTIITESTVICEYLEDVFPDAGNKLRPEDASQRAEMRVWTKWVDEYFCWCVSNIGWAFGVRDLARSMSDLEFEAHLERVPVFEQRLKWRRARDGFPSAVIDDEFRKVGASVERLEATLSRQKFLLESDYSLADICVFAIAHRLGREDGNFSDLVNASQTPGLLDWIDRIRERPAIMTMFEEVRSEKLLTEGEPA